MKKLLLAAFLALVPSLAFAQCNGVMSPGSVCGVGNAESARPAHQVTSGSISFPIVIGTTLVNNGNTGRVLYDNAGIVGEYTITGTAGSVVMSVSPTVSGATLSTVNITSGVGVFTTGLSNTTNQNASTDISVTNTTNAALSQATFFATSDTAAGRFGVGATTNATTFIAGRAFVYGIGTGIAIGSSSAFPIFFGISSAEVGKWDSATPGKLILGSVGTVVGQSCFANATTGTICVSPPTGALGTIAIVVPATAGTLATTATSPVTLNATTGVVACATCVTSSGGGAITGTAPISVSAAGVVSLDAAGVTYAKIQNLGALAVMGRSANSSGVGADIQATAASDAVFRESGSTIGFGTIATAGIANNAVTLAKLATQATNTVLGNTTSGTAVPTALAVSSCSSASSALIWTTNTGFGCNTSITAAAVPASGLTGTTLASNVVTSSLTTIGTIGIGVWQGTAVAAGFGGTGIASYAVGDLLYASGTTTLSKLADVATGSVLVSGGVTTAPAWSAAITVTTSVTTAALSGTTSITSPLHIGGSGTTGTQLTIKTTTGNGTTDAMVFTGGNNGAQTIATFLGAGNVGFGTGAGAAAPTNTQMVISRNATTVDAAQAGVTPLLHLVASTSEIGGLILDGFANFNTIAYRRAEGTAASKTAVTSGQRLGAFLSYGWDTAAYGSGPLIALLAGETFSATAHGSYVDFQTVALTTTTQQSNIRFQGSGGVTIGNAIITTDPGSGGLIANGATIKFTALANVATTSAICYNTATGLLTYDGTIGTCNVSDERLKNMGERIEHPLDRLLQINGVHYTWKDASMGIGPQIGVGAQTVERVFPELVQTDSTGRKSADYGRLTAPIIEALRELKANNDNMKSEIAMLKRGSK